jgi:SAM-dependent methyltransferase
MNETLSYPGLQGQPDHGATPGRLVRTARRFLRAQFGRPTGPWGSLAGRIMARTPSNNERIDWTLELLAIQPSDRILEIGFGPGVAIALASHMAPNGVVTGIDHSEVMVRQASKRNAQALREGKVRLLLGSPATLPRFDAPFDKIFTINSIHFWQRPVHCLQQLRSVLRVGGLIAVTVQPRSRGATHETTSVVGKDLLAHLTDAGFSECRLEVRRAKPVSVACALGLNPGLGR